MRWEISGCTVTVSRMCSKQHAGSLCSSHPAFSPSILLESRRCTHAVILISLQLEIIPFSIRVNFTKKIFKDNIIDIIKLF